MKIKISNLFLVSSIISFAFMVLIFIITYIYFNKYQDSVKLLNYSNTVVTMAEDMLDISIEMDAFLDMYKITNNTDYLTSYYEVKQRFDKTLDELHELVKGDFDQTSRVILIQAIFSQWEERVMYYTLGDNTRNGKLAELEKIDAKLHRDLKFQIENFIADENKLQNTRREKQKENLVTFLTILPTAIIIIGLLMVALNMFLTNLINRPINQLVRMANKLSNKEFEFIPAFSNRVSMTPRISPIELDALHRDFVFMAHNLKNSYHELEELNENLQAINKSKDEFVAMVSHELRTPLNAIIGFSELLLDPDFGPLNERQQSYVDDIRKSGIHQLSIINDLLDLAKIETGNMELSSSPANPKEIIDSTMATMKELANIGEVDLICEIDSQIPENLPLDERKFKQILLNLLSNAIKFTPPKKKVGLKADYYEKNLMITVWDEGIGISKENQAKIFEKFAQIDSELSRKYTGTGLGLPLVKALVSLHGGRLLLESEEGRGSRFTVILPTPNGEKYNSNNADTSRNLFSTNILLITPDRALSTVVSYYLSNMEVNILIAKDMKEANNIISNANVEMIILDIHDNGSWSILQTIKSDPATANIPLSIISIDNQLDKASQFGVSDFLTKPLDKGILIDTIKRNIYPEKEDVASILIVDDDPLVHKLFDGVLDDSRYALHHAMDGEEALSMLRAGGVKPDIIILDMIMPKLNGLDMLKELKSDEALANIPVIILTSKDLSSSEIELLKQYNAPQYYTKGTMLDRIVDRITKIKTGKVNLG